MQKFTRWWWVNHWTRIPVMSAPSQGKWRKAPPVVRWDPSPWPGRAKNELKLTKKRLSITVLRWYIDGVGKEETLFPKHEGLIQVICFSWLKHIQVEKMSLLRSVQLQYIHNCLCSMVCIYFYNIFTYNLFFFDSMNMLECTKVSVCILSVQYFFATSLANVCWYDCWHVALQPEVWMYLRCVSGVPKRLLV